MDPEEVVDSDDTEPELVCDEDPEGEETGYVSLEVVDPDTNALLLEDVVLSVPEMVVF